MAKVITYIEVVQEDIFMEQKMRFGLVLGRVAVLKKESGAGARVFFSCFQGFFFLNIVASALKSYIK